MWRGIEAVRPGMHLGDIGHAIQSSRRAARLQRGARVLRARHRPQVPRGAAGPALRAARDRRAAGAGHDLHDRAHDQRRQGRYPAARRRLDGASPRTTACRRNGSTRCWSLRTGYEVLTLSAGAPVAVRSSSRERGRPRPMSRCAGSCRRRAPRAHRARGSRSSRRRARNPARSASASRASAADLLRRQAAARRPPAEGSLGEPRDAARRRAGRRGRLRARRAVPLLRRRPPDPARRRRRTQRSPASSRT